MYRECKTGKVPHATEVVAQIAADRMNARPDRVGVARPYVCPYCRQWHIGRSKFESAATAVAATTDGVQTS